MKGNRKFSIFILAVLMAIAMALSSTGTISTYATNVGGNGETTNETHFLSGGGVSEDAFGWRVYIVDGDGAIVNKADGSQAVCDLLFLKTLNVASRQAFQTAIDGSDSSVITSDFNDKVAGKLYYPANTAIGTCNYTGLNIPVIWMNVGDYSWGMPNCIGFNRSPSTTTYTAQGDALKTWLDTSAKRTYAGAELEMSNVSWILLRAFDITTATNFMSGEYDWHLIFEPTIMCGEFYEGDSGYNGRWLQLTFREALQWEAQVGYTDHQMQGMFHRIGASVYIKSNFTSGSTYTAPSTHYIGDSHSDSCTTLANVYDGNQEIVSGYTSSSLGTIGWGMGEYSVPYTPDDPIHTYNGSSSTPANAETATSTKHNTGTTTIIKIYQNVLLKSDNSVDSISNAGVYKREQATNKVVIEDEEEATGYALVKWSDYDQSSIPTTADIRSQNTSSGIIETVASGLTAKESSSKSATTAVTTTTDASPYTVQGTVIYLLYQKEYKRVDSFSG